MADRQRVVHRGVVAAHRVEIRSQQEARSALHRHPHLRGGVRLREWLAVGARDAGAGPRRVAAAAACGTARRAHFITPMFAAMIFAAIDQKARAGTQRIVGLAERRHPAVPVVIHADIEPDFRHPLGMPHRAGPRSPHLLRRAPAAIDDLQRVDQFGFPIGAAARFVPGERRQRGKYRPHMVLLHQRIAIGGFDTPQRQQRAALDAEILLDPRKQRLVLLQRFLAGDDAPVRDAAIDVLPDLLVEFRLLLHLLEHGHVRLDAAHHAGPGRVRDALGQRPRAKAVAPLIEAGRGGGERGEGMREQGAGAEAGSQQGAARRRVQRIRLFHRASLAILLQICGNFGQPAPDRCLRLGAQARPSAAAPGLGRTAGICRAACRRVGSASTAAPGRAPGAAFFLMAPSRSRLRMMTPTVCGVSSATRARSAPDRPG